MQQIGLLITDPRSGLWRDLSYIIVFVNLSFWEFFFLVCCDPNVLKFSRDWMGGREGEREKGERESRRGREGERENKRDWKNETDTDNQTGGQINQQTKRKRNTSTHIHNYVYPQTLTQTYTCTSISSHTHTHTVTRSRADSNRTRTQCSPYIRRFSKQQDR